MKHADVKLQFYAVHSNNALKPLSTIGSCQYVQNKLNN